MVENNVLKAIDLVFSKFPDGASAIKYYMYYKLINFGYIFLIIMSLFMIGAICIFIICSFFTLDEWGEPHFRSKKDITKQEFNALKETIAILRERVDFLARDYEKRNKV